jgi:hypothetical protein
LDLAKGFCLDIGRGQLPEPLRRLVLEELDRAA